MFNLKDEAAQKITRVIGAALLSFVVAMLSYCESTNLKVHNQVETNTKNIRPVIENLVAETTTNKHKIQQVEQINDFRYEHLKQKCEEVEKKVWELNNKKHS